MKSKSKSKKSPAFQAAVALRAVSGQPKVQIAKEMGIGETTVYRILDSLEMKEFVEQARSRCFQMIPDAVENIRHHLAEKSLPASAIILRGTKVLANGNDNATKADGPAIVVNVVVGEPSLAQELMGLIAKSTAPGESPVLDAEQYTDERSEEPSGTV